MWFIKHVGSWEHLQIILMAKTVVTDLLKFNQLYLLYSKGDYINGIYWILFCEFNQCNLLHHVFLLSDHVLGSD